MINKYLKQIQEQVDKKALRLKIIDFFTNNPKPSDSNIHAFANKEGIEPDQFEEHVYSILGSFLGSGKSKTFKGSYDPEQIKIGIKVEMEHTDCPIIAERIAKDHLAEFPDYYTRLQKMEKEAEVSD